MNDRSTPSPLDRRVTTAGPDRLSRFRSRRHEAAYTAAVEYSLGLIFLRTR